MTSSIHVPPRSARSGAVSPHVLLRHEGTEYLALWSLPDSAHRLGAPERYVALPRTSAGPGEPVELTVLRRGHSAQARARLEEEVWLGAQLSHSAIARVLGLYEQEGDCFLVVERLVGCNLETVVSLDVLRGQRMSESFCLYVCGQVAGALEHVHTRTDARGQPLDILHRSVSPEAVRVGWRHGEVQLTDFSSAFSRRPGRVTSPEELVRGCLDTAAPERLPLTRLGDGVDARADLFSLGVLLLELLTGCSLYDLETVEAAAWRAPRALRRRVHLKAELPSWIPVEEMAVRAAALHPAQVEAVLRGAHVSETVGRGVLGLLRHVPAERCATAAQARAALEECLRGASYGAREAAHELGRARDEARCSPRRAFAEVFEPGVL